MENEELVLQIQAGINKTENMEQLYLQNRNFIYGIAKKYAAYAEMDDLMQEAYFGLAQAVEHFEPLNECKFLTYLPHRLQAVLGRYVDNNGHIKRIPVQLLQRISKYKKYIAEQSAKGVTATDSTICWDLAISEQQLKNLRKAMYEADCGSINDSKPGTDGLTYEDTIADPLNLEEQVLDTVTKEQAESLIWKIVSKLEEKQADVISGRYRKSATLEELGKQLNLSHERIRVIERNALYLLRKKKEIKNIAEIYGYMNAYQNTGFSYFKNTGTSSTERAAIRHIEAEEQIKRIQQGMEQRKNDIKDILNMNELFNEVLNIAAQ